MVPARHRSTESWLRWYGSRGGQAKTRLYVFGYAGGGASAYRAWNSMFDSSVEVCAIQLPGREDRFAEPLVSDFDVLATRIFDAFVPTADLPFWFFGHSLGALLAYDLSCRLYQSYGISPRHLIVSAHRAPHQEDSWPPLDSISDDEMVLRLKNMNGTPDAVFEAAELVALMLPIVRADLKVAETFRFAGPSPLLCPITAVGGDDDAEVSLAHLEAWGEHTTGPFQALTMPGGHFFLRQQEPELIGLIGKKLGLAGN